MANIFHVDRANNEITLGVSDTNITFTPMTQGSVLFAGASGLLSQDNAAFKWDDTKKQFQIVHTDGQTEKHLLLQRDADEVGLKCDTSGNFEVTAINTFFDGAVAGAIKTLRLWNESSDANSHTKLQLLTQTGTAGDPSLHLSVNTVTDWSIGIDNSDSDKLKIGPSGVVGTSTACTIDTTGKIGFGTETPAQQVHVYSAASSNLLVGDDTGTADNNFQGWRIQANTNGNLYFDHKTFSAGSINFRCGEGVEVGAQRTWLVVDPTDGDCSFKTANFGDGGSTNYSEFEADGTLEFNGAATVWNDFVVPVQVASRSTVPGTTAPNELAYRSGLVYEFPDGVDRACYFVIQLPHTYKEGTDIVFHIHWTIDTTGGGAGAENVEWDYSYSASSPGQSPEEQWPAATTGTTTVDVQNDNQHDHLIDNIVTITGTNFKISEVLIMSLTRTGSTDSYTGHALLVSADVHHEIDTVGSRQITTK
jgi:hypothetical protein